MTSGDLAPLHFSNAHPIRDRISVGADTFHLTDIGSSVPWLDRQFGNAWNWTPADGAAVYGRTSMVPRGPLDDGTRDVLRTPFRRIPIIDIHSLEEALALGLGNASRDPSITGMWRGQSRHHSLTRDPTDRRRLYGDEPADEPSMPPSAARQGVYFPDVAEAWTGLLDLYIEERLEALSVFGFPKADAVRREAESFRASYRYRTWAFATAQHYGLPSVGLDLTSDIRVALYFALHRFSTDRTTGYTQVERATEADSPILYGLGVFDYDLIVDEAIAPAWLACARPAAQRAHFFATAWGDSGNRAADRIYVAARLKNHTEWPSPLATAEVFPSIDDDRFLAFLLKSKGKFRAIPILDDLLSRIYYR